MLGIFFPKLRLVRILTSLCQTQKELELKQTLNVSVSGQSKSSASNLFLVTMTLRVINLGCHRVQRRGSFERRACSVDIFQDKSRDVVVCSRVNLVMGGWKGSGTRDWGTYYQSKGGKSFLGQKDSCEPSRDQTSERAVVLGRDLSKRPLYLVSPKMSSS